jgi:hypothetical protein
MGKLIWSQWARLMALTAGVFETIGGIFGIFYRLSMFGGLTSIFNPIILKINIVAIICIVFGIIIVLMEYPVPLLRNTVLTNTFFIKIFLYLIVGAFSILNYQNVNPGVYLIISSLMYTKASINNEMTKPKTTSGVY